MTVTAQDGKLTFNPETGRWEDEDGNIGWEHKRVCSQCGKPRLDLNGVSDCDFCLQALTSCDFIDNACCGHGVDENAYISLKDGRRFALDTASKEVVNKLNELSEENKQLRKTEKINMEYAGQIVEENQKLRIAKNDLRIENERLKSRNNYNLEDCLLEIVELKEENKQLKSENKKLRCINEQLEERLENSGIGIALKMDCDMNE